jgi:UDP-N-acetylmuramoyl-tripeptide--D-alanyl-D-alanine ligase
VQVTQTLQDVREDGVPHLSASVSYGGTVFTLELPGVVGTHHAHTIAAAACVGIIFGATLQDIARAFMRYTPPAGSLRVLPGVKGSMLIADAYDAHLLSTMADFDLLAAYPGKRKIVVLGDLLDLGSRSMDVHERIGATVAGIADLFIAIGTRAHIAADAALKAKMNKKKVFAFARAEEAAVALQDLLKKGDVVLLTGSRVMRLDTIVEEVRLQEAVDFARAAQA